jgi:hypothetical protein
MDVYTAILGAHTGEWRRVRCVSTAAPVSQPKPVCSRRLDTTTHQLHVWRARIPWRPPTRSTCWHQSTQDIQTSGPAESLFFLLLFSGQRGELQLACGGLVGASIAPCFSCSTRVYGGAWFHLADERPRLPLFFFFFCIVSSTTRTYRGNPLGDVYSLLRSYHHQSIYTVRSASQDQTCLWFFNLLTWAGTFRANGHGRYCSSCLVIFRRRIHQSPPERNTHTVSRGWIQVRSPSW